MREHLGEEVELLERDSAVLGRARAAARCCAAGWRPRRSAPPCAARARGSSTPTTSTRARLARARRGARGGRARRAAPAQLPARLRGRDVLQLPRRGLHALPGPRHAGRRAPELPRDRPGGRRVRSVARALAAAAGRAGRRGRRAERVRRRAAAGARRADRAAPSRRAAMSCARSPSARRPRRRARARRRALAPRRASRSRSGRARRRACRSSSPATGPRRDGAAGARHRGVRFAGRESPRRARRRCGARGPGDRALALRRRRSASPRPRRWPPACPWWPPRSARCPSSSAADGLVPPGDAAALAAAARARFGDEEAGSAGLRAGARSSPRRRRSQGCSRRSTADQRSPFDRGAFAARGQTSTSLGAAWPPLMDALSGLVWPLAGQGTTPSVRPSRSTAEDRAKTLPRQWGTICPAQACLRARRASAQCLGSRAVQPQGPSCGIRFGMPASTP